MSVDKNNLKNLFFPNKVAVVGATERDGSVGLAITKNLSDKFDGEVVPVNPNRDEVLGMKAYPDITSFPGEIDLAVVVVPPKIANQTVKEAGENGVKNVIVITAGYGESGSEGLKREKELQESAEKYDLNLVGPNSLGVISTPVNLNATFGPEEALPGSISFMSQSGALITAVLSWAEDRGIGFHNIVSLGNEAALDETSFLKAWSGDEGTDVIIAYLEGIGDGQEFISTGREVTESTPIVVIKSGRTEEGAKAVSSHTGTLAGSESAYEAGLEQAGVIRVDNIGDLFDYAEILSGQPLPENDKVGIVTNAGGPGIMATDTLGVAGLSLASFEDETLSKLGDFLPEEANIYNPIDVLGDSDLDRFKKAVDIAMGDSQVGSVIAISYPSAILGPNDLAEELVKIQNDHEKTLVSCIMGGGEVNSAESILREEGIPNYFDPERAVKSVGILNKYKQIKEREYQEPADFWVNRSRANEILAQVRARTDNRLGVEAMGLLEAYGIPIPDSEIVGGPDQAEEAAKEIGDEVVLKIVSPDILHKSDIGGVKVGVPVEKVRDEYEDLIVRARNYQPDATLLGVQVQEMVDAESGVETILGMNKDPQFGPVIMLGLGGIFVEVLEDTSFRVAPISEREGRQMINELESAPIFRGARGKEAVNIDKVVETIQRLSQMVMDIPAILELDINPCVATSEGVKAVDLRLTVDEDKLRI